MSRRLPIADPTARSSRPGGHFQQRSKEPYDRDDCRAAASPTREHRRKRPRRDRGDLPSGAARACVGDTGGHHRGGSPPARRRAARPTRSADHAERGAGGPTRGAGVLSRGLVPILQPGAAHLSGRARGRARGAGRAAGCRQPPTARRLADHAGEARSALPRAIGPGQRLGPDGGHHDPAGRGGAGGAAEAGPRPRGGQRRRHAGHPDANHRDLDRDRIVQWVDVHPDYSTRSEPEQVLAALDALARA